ncbi:hypothetical protein M8756_00130 [Lutimaribacter sp. EGI FJ00015]|uniref:Uncharacterized protein n=1 Tax=Lutimaribacter degradans TaxID=2945989 RepID=A0ACC5ZTS6_9RHOB|nr:hypothetical protein [Lutimaribacter sp. EGI FJ00013]MCM2561348.1 hypothetical protein [Lutimaribacter sp. EGI FJ00013]MCO0611701.1 hypothetical protein [Lutimaribacter sp. EGI FJ00015]MCO0635177.1 hypothetical protein [Lutimaribacter sp. EGI FJ00014]
MNDHLPPDARAAHDAMLDAWDALTDSIVKREGAAMEAKARAEGKSATEAAQAAQDHVKGLLIQMTRERARLEAEGARRQ